MNLTSLTTKDWHARAAGLRYETRHFIDGQYVDSAARGRFTVVNPATGAPLCEVSAGTAADIDLAVAAAKRSFASRVWSRKAPRDRMAIRYRLDAFDAPIEVKMVWNPPGISSQSEATIPKGATNVSYQLNAGGGAETRAWRIALLGHATVEGGEFYVSTQPAKLEVATPFVTGKIETLWVQPGKTAKLTVNRQTV